MAAKKIKVLIVDDSMVQREMLSKWLSASSDIEVVAKASNAFEARDKIIEYRPDVMTCDIQMPKMDGIEFIRRLIPQYPIPVVVVSAVSESVFEAMEAGAVEFIAKPFIQSRQDMNRFIEEVKQKIRIAVVSKVSSSQCKKVKLKSNNHSDEESRMIIAIGASTGGTEAIYSILKQLPPTIPGIVIVQHIPPVFSRMFAERLCKQTDLDVKEAETGDRILSGRVLIAPGDMHMEVCKFSNGFKVNCHQGERVSGHCPSVDVLFKSVAKSAGKNAVGVLLTGMGRDGAKGLLEMKKSGARTIGQDEQSCVVYGMPNIAFKMGAVEKQADLSAIPDMICSLSKKD